MTVGLHPRFFLDCATSWHDKLKSNASVVKYNIQNRQYTSFDCHFALIFIWFAAIAGFIAGDMILLITEPDWVIES
jgi:hypothetical protein